MTLDTASTDATVASDHVIGAAQRVIESATIAIVASSGLYLVGSVYTQSFYGRMSIEVASLDLSPPFIALQSTHAVDSLLEYPGTLLIFYLLYRAFSSQIPRFRSWYDRVYQQFGRLFLLIVNVLIVSPLVVAAIQAGNDRDVIFTSSVLSEVASLMETTGILLLIYVVWLSLVPRLTLFSQVRQRKLIPIALLFVVYLLDAMMATAHGAALDAELLMLGESDSSIEVEFTLADGVATEFPAAGLILVTARNGNFYVVERQSFPPSGAPTAYVIPFDVVDVARTRRLTDADVEVRELMFEDFATPGAP